MDRNTITNLDRAGLTAAGVVRFPKREDAIAQAKANNTAVMYRCAFGFRVCLPQQMPGDMNLGYTGSFDALHDELVADGYAVEVLGL